MFFGVRMGLFFPYLSDSCTGNLHFSLFRRYETEYIHRYSTHTQWTEVRQESGLCDSLFFPRPFAVPSVSLSFLLLPVTHYSPVLYLDNARSYMCGLFAVLLLAMCVEEILLNLNESSPGAINT